MRWPWQPKPAPVDVGYLADTIDANVGLAASMNTDQATRLVQLTTELFNDKAWEAAAGFALTDEMIVTVAANAAIPILSLGTWAYRNVNAIVLHPTTTTHTTDRMGPTAGVVADHEMQVVGLASPNSGPVSLSWDAVLTGSRNPDRGLNVVIHEFAHKIDMTDGAADGVPPLRGAALGDWAAMLSDEYEHSKVLESDAVLRPYAWTNKAEFFAVASEAFYCQPRALKEAKPRLYECLEGFYQHDPAAWT